MVGTRSVDSFARAVPVATYFVAAILLVEVELWCSQPLLWLVVLIFAGPLTTAVAEHGYAAVAEAMLCTLRRPRSAEDQLRADDVWSAIGFAATPVALIWAVTTAYSLPGSWDMRLSLFAIAVVYGVSLADSAFGFRAALTPPSDVSAGAREGLARQAPVLVLPWFAVMGLMVTHGG